MPGSPAAAHWVYASDQRSDDSAIAELFAHAARRGAVLRQPVSGDLLYFTGDGAQGSVADLSFRRTGDAAAGLGAARQLAAPPLFADHHGDRRQGCG